ncbi:MAG: pirin family protein [Pseudanabaena sp. Salubria-1]|nr:pirin family protein [Pseudanabaena sp. Salubria-1]
MLTLRPSSARGHFNFGWLDTFHTFSFGDYRDPQHMAFRSLRVINEDRVDPAKGFDTHPHRDMEIITYVLSGALSHKDSSGGKGIIKRGDVQRMTAGSGIEHSEANESKTEAVHLLQIWLFPKSRGLPPSYDQKHFSDDEKRNALRLLVSPSGEGGSLTIQQDASIFASILEVGHTLNRAIAPGRHVWIQLITGAITVNDQRMTAGDGLAVSDETALAIQATDKAEFLYFDLA